MMAHRKALAGVPPHAWRAAAVLAAVLATLPVEAQTPNLTITPGQRVWCVLSYYRDLAVCRIYCVQTAQVIRDE